MVFKRAKQRTWWRATVETVYPRGGWGRAATYIRHRITRLPDRPNRIARGIFAGVFVTFTPLYGFHFFIAFAMAKLMRGNVVAALLSTFVGNPLTFPFIAAGSLGIGNWMLGIDGPVRIDREFWRTVGAPFRESWVNLKHLVTGEPIHWIGTAHFYDTIFFPYLIGGLVPGALAGLASYLLSEPLIRRYQQRRKGRLAQKFRELTSKREKAKATKTSGLGQDSADA